MTAAPEVGVVLCCAGPGTYLNEQLAALAGQVTGRRWELVFVDNGCTSDCLDTVAAWLPRFPAARVVSAREVRGPANGRTVGAKATTAPRVLFCDDDDVVDAGWLDAMAAALNDADLVGGRLRTGRLGIAAHGRTPIQEAELPTVHAYRPYVMSCSMGVRRDAFLAIGGFDPTFYPGEDVDLSWRMQSAGARMAFVPGAVTDYRRREGASALARQQASYGRTAALLRVKHRKALAPLQPAAEARLALRLLVGVRHAPHAGARRTAWWGVVRYWWAERSSLVAHKLRVASRPSPSRPSR